MLPVKRGKKKACVAITGKTTNQQTGKNMILMIHDDETFGNDNSFKNKYFMLRFITLKVWGYNNMISDMRCIALCVFNIHLFLF